MRLAVCVLVLVPGLLLAGQTGEEARKQAMQRELELFQGAWTVASVERDGRPDDTFKNFQLVFTAEKFRTMSMDKIVRQGTMKLDPLAKPKTIDITYSDGPDKGRSRLGIYEIEGNTMKVCYGDLGKDRPTEFDSKPGTGQWLLVLKRNKP